MLSIRFYFGGNLRDPNYRIFSGKCEIKMCTVEIYFSSNSSLLFHTKPNLTKIDQRVDYLRH